ncbi:hypothetical protein ACFX1T_009456 [Malus domestica]
MSSLFSSHIERLRIGVTPYSWSWRSDDDRSEINGLIAPFRAILSRFSELFLARSLVSIAACFCASVEPALSTATSY